APPLPEMPRPPRAPTGRPNFSNYQTCTASPCNASHSRNTHIQTSRRRSCRPRHLNPSSPHSSKPVPPSVGTKSMRSVEPFAEQSSNQTLQRARTKKSQTAAESHVRRHFAHRYLPSIDSHLYFTELSARAVLQFSAHFPYESRSRIYWKPCLERITKLIRYFSVLIR